MKFMLFVLPTVPATLEERRRLRPIGRNNERYQQMLEEMRKLAVLADDAGFDVFATTEHHFHSEGFECSVAPLLLYADLAARTKRIKFAPLALVLPAWDPIRCAEELAVLDNLTQGRVYAGFARGYQDRWTNILGQQYHVSGAPRPYQDPHPALFQPFSVSEKTIRYTAAEGIVPWILTSYPPEFRRLCEVYRDVARENGRPLELGQSVGAFRAVHFGDTE